MSERMIRLWGAVMTEDGPVAEVRDVPAGDTIGDILDDSTFRVWSISSLEYLSREGHSRGKPCIPGQPCKKCQTAALAWWWEHGRRTKVRSYMAANERARKDAERAYRMADHGPERDNLEAAADDARERGWGLVRELNGHGRTMGWSDV